MLFTNRLPLNEWNPPLLAWVRHRRHPETHDNRSVMSVQQAPMENHNDGIPFWRSPFCEGDPQQVCFPFGRYRVSSWMPLSCRRFVPKTLRACWAAVVSHHPNSPNRLRSSGPESSAWCQQKLGSHNDRRVWNIWRTSSSNVSTWSMLLGYPSIRNLLLPWVFDASILAFNKLIVNCAGMMTELCMLSSINVANGEPGRSISSRKRSPTDKCWKSRSWANREHWVPFPTPGPPVIQLGQRTDDNVRSSTKHEDDQGTGFPAGPESLSLKH